ncbi:MAG TPA: hypothetical protein VFG43_13285, partial [Geminicoccaceae bacterium]|nr:hypothetical protein [Geminicoccaceae bacterium]
DSNVQVAVVKSLVAPRTPRWALHPAFVEFAVREAARITLARESAWIYSAGTLSSFLSSETAEQREALRRRPDTSDDQGVAFALALRAVSIGPGAWMPMLDLAHRDGAGALARFFLRLLAEDTQRPLLDVMGAVQVPEWERVGRGAKAARALFEVFRQADSQGLHRLRQEAAQRLAVTAQHAEHWSSADLVALREYGAGLPATFRPALQDRIETLEREDLVQRIIGWASAAVVAHVVLWLALALAYPHSRVVQAVFFWNPWVRKIVGLGYAVPLLLLIPPLRRRLVAPFAGTLLADARLDAFEPAAYYDRSWVKPLVGDRAGGARVRLLDEIPEVRNHIVLEGASGLGKTQALRLLAARAGRPLVFLPARRIAGTEGPLEAIQQKMQGWARDPDFIRSLLHVNALDLAIDGLNEVSGQTRERIVRFVEDLPKANIILTTQPIAWEPPQAGATRRYELQPLDREQITDFLLSRGPHLEDAVVRGSAYELACQRFLDDALEADLSEEERRQNLVVLSNPMDLTIVAELIGVGESPSLARLIEQQYERMAASFQKTHQRPFPLAEVAKQAFELRRNDDNRLRLESAALDALVRFKLVLQRESMDTPGVYEYHFRHDKIMEMFIAAHLLTPEGGKAIDELVGDPRFSGVLVELASLLSIGGAWALGKRIAENAERTGEHWVSSAYMRRLLVRPDLPRQAAA